VFVVVLLLVLWPLVEIAVFLQVVQWIGVLDTLALMLLISLGGAWIVKRQGVGTMARMRAELDAGRVPAGPLVDGALLLVAGLLLLVPGFVTDAFGLLLLIPPVRAGVKAVLGRRFVVRARRRVRRAPPGPGRAPDDGNGWDPPELLP
jgi:UPF0716 protein FxsA